MDTDAAQNPIATLALEIAPDAEGIVPSEAHLLPPGPFRSDFDGRPRDVSAWLLDAAIAGRLAGRMAARANDTLIDYEHQSRHAEWNGQPAPAAGWFRDMAWRDDGLHAVGVRWTERARQMIAAREYRYISAVFSYLPSTGEVLEIVSVALTNTPALDGLDALVAARRINPSTQGDADMAEEKEVAALKSERDGIKTELAALKASTAALAKERDAALEKLGAASSELAGIKAKAAEAALAAEKAERGKLLEGVPPALRPSIEELALSALKEYVEKAAPLGLLARQADPHAAPAAAALTKEEAEYCEKLGVSHEEFKKAKE